LRLSCKVVGCDLNPVAWYLVSQAMRRADVPQLTESFQRVADSVEVARRDPLGGVRADGDRSANARWPSVPSAARTGVES
jgi:hypothetical protein